MKKFLFPLFALCWTGMTFTACDDDNNGSSDDMELTAKEKTLRAAVLPYVENTVLPTYAEMADYAILLEDQCELIEDKFEDGTLTVADVKKAGEYWKASRKAWELSEAFLFGPAANHNIDPHIDSWPLDKNAMDDLLVEIRNGKKKNVDNLGYGLKGFHSVEYVLFQLSEDGMTSSPRDPKTYTKEELDYLEMITEDLRDQCVLLEACWAGFSNLSKEKRDIVEDLDYGDNYGWQMKNAGKAGSIFKTYQEVAEEIIQGCIDIADEVGNTKIGRPHLGSSEDDRNYIESPYSLNSIEDFQDNIRSIQNSYLGSRTGDASISDFVKQKDAALDQEVRAALEDAIAKIGLIPEPFAKTARTDANVPAAIEACNAIVDVLGRVNAVLYK